MTKTQHIRKALREQYGARRYRITRTGEIHVLSIMPNTADVGWWLYGYIDDRQTLERLGL